MMDECLNSEMNEIPRPELDSESDIYLSDRYQNYDYISPTDLTRYLSDPTCHPYDYLLILDARFDYEFKGGRIFGAQNITSYTAFFKFFDKYKNETDNGKSICIIIHCEHSSKRGPRLYDLLREYDRNTHISQYPKLSFPNIFLLEGGYKKFFALHSEFCIGGYVSMFEPQFISNHEIKRCQKSYFTDYNERLDIFSQKNCSNVNHNLKLYFKFSSHSEYSNDKKEIEESDAFDSQPMTETYQKEKCSGFIEFI